MADSRTCDACGARYAPQRSTSRYCSTRCRQRAHRAGERASEATPQPGAIARATWAELTRGRVQQTALGAVAMVLAAHLDSITPATASAAAPLAREHRATMAAVMANARPTGERDPLAEIRARRDAKRDGPMG